MRWHGTPKARMDIFVNRCSLRIACLEGGTCSDRATSYFLQQYVANRTHTRRHRFRSLEQAVAWMRKEEDQSTILLLPHLHEIASRLSMDPSFEMLTDKILVLPNPPLYLAKGSAQSLSAPRCAIVRTLVPLLRIPDAAPQFAFIYVDNTQAAARLAAAATTEFCVTNRTGLKTYHLQVVRRLKHMAVVWLPFVCGMSNSCSGIRRRSNGLRECLDS